MEKPLILITNDDGITAKGLRILVDVCRGIGDVVVMAPASNASGFSHSITTSRPLRVNEYGREEGCTMYTCDGTPVDCVKLALAYFCPRQPSLVLSGINHGSNSSINILYSGTLGAVREATVCGYNAVGFSLLNHSPKAEFGFAVPYVEQIIRTVLGESLPSGVSLNVNIPNVPTGALRGVKVCRQSEARWVDSYERREDPVGRPYYWLTGQFECADNGEGTDQWALEHGYVSLVPVAADSTAYGQLSVMSTKFECQR